jgi:hypothetical protein
MNETIDIEKKVKSLRKNVKSFGEMILDLSVKESSEVLKKKTYDLFPKKDFEEIKMINKP